ncbi:MAG: GNAT family N-acetyltransferase [Ornithinibacter sp.]
MTDVGPGDRLVVELVTAASWRTWRDVRLASLIDSPRAFWVQYAEAAERTDHEWRERAATTGSTWLAFDDGRPVGTVGLWHAPEQPAAEVYLVGMWVASVARGSDVATRLVGAALTSAAASGFRRVVLDVAHENARARAFYARMGFRPTGAVDRMPWDPSVTEETLALDLPVGS